MKKTSFSIRSVRLVLVYFIFILDYRNDIRQKKQIRAIFLFKVEMGCKAVETTHNINNAFDPGTATYIQCSGGSRSFVKETRTLKMRSVIQLVIGS